MWFVFTFFFHHIVILIWQKSNKISKERKIQIHRCTIVREHLSSSTEYLWTLNRSYRSALDLLNCMAFRPSLKKSLPMRYHWLTIANMSCISDLTPWLSIGKMQFLECFITAPFWRSEDIVLPMNKAMRSIIFCNSKSVSLHLNTLSSSTYLAKKITLRQNYIEFTSCKNKYLLCNSSELLMW